MAYSLAYRKASLCLRRTPVFDNWRHAMGRCHKGEERRKPADDGQPSICFVRDRRKMFVVGIGLTMYG